MEIVKEIACWVGGHKPFKPVDKPHKIGQIVMVHVNTDEAEPVISTSTHAVRGRTWTCRCEKRKGPIPEGAEAKLTPNISNGPVKMQ